MQTARRRSAHLDLGSPSFTPAARKLGIACASATALLGAVYAVTLAVGLLSLASPDEPIRDPLFSLLEILILLLAPAMTALMAAIHAWAPVRLRACTMTALVFIGVTAAITCSVHFSILTLSRHTAFQTQEWAALLLSFRWPSVAYALDILAWDVFFALAVLCAAPAFSGDRLAASIRVLLVLSGVLALAGLSGVPSGDMRLRNIGIVGYAVLFPVAASLIAILFRRSRSLQ